MYFPLKTGMSVQNWNIFSKLPTNNFPNETLVWIINIDITISQSGPENVYKYSSVRISTIMCNVPEQRSRCSDYSGHVRNRGLASGWGKVIFLTPRHHDQTLVQPHFCPEYSRISPPGKSGQGVKVATYPQLIPRLRKSETLLPFLHTHCRQKPPTAGSGPV
jgi:hypothetical protein